VTPLPVARYPLPAMTSLLLRPGNR
jgi:hypothetical protein